MCIVCVKPTGAKMPKEKIFRDCFINNPDGAGIAYWRSGDTAVNIRKGFMTIDALLGALKELKLNRTDALMLHFRWATHGALDAGACHPFPVSNKIADLRAVALSVPVAVAHNGIFSSMPEHLKLSDSQKFVMQVLSDKHVIDNLDSRSIQALLKGYCGTGSKLGFLKADGTTYTIGSWSRHKGAFYSNEGFRAPRVAGYGGYTPLAGANKARWSYDAGAYDWTNCEQCGSQSLVRYDAESGRDLCFDCRNSLNRPLIAKK